MEKQFPSNANKDVGNPLTKPTPQTAAAPGPEEKNIPQIVTAEGVVKKTKTPWRRRVVQTFFAGDARSVRDYIVKDVFIPTVKFTFVDAVEQAVGRAVLGDNYARRGPSNGGLLGGIGGGFRGNIIQHTNYNAMSQGVAARREDPREVIERRHMQNNDPGQYTFSDRATAEQVVIELANVVNEFGIVTVADLKRMINEPREFTDNNFGWDNLAGADVIGNHSRGFTLVLPKARQIQ